MASSWMEGKFFAALLVSSALLNVGLSYKVGTQRDVLHKLQSGNSGERILGARVDSLDVRDLDGKPLKLSFTRNSVPTLIYVFRPSCGWCAKNLANLRTLQAQASAQHFNLVGLSLDAHALKGYVKDKGLTFPVYSDVSPSEAIRLDMGATPQTIMIANNTVVREWGGAYTPDLQKEIESTLGIKLPGISEAPVPRE